MLLQLLLEARCSSFLNLESYVLLERLDHDLGVFILAQRDYQKSCRSYSKFIIVKNTVKIQSVAGRSVLTDCNESLLSQFLSESIQVLCRLERQ